MIRAVAICFLRRVFELCFYFMLAALSVTVWLWYYEEAPVRFYERSVLTPEVRAGGTLIIQSKAFRTKNCPTITRRVLYDGLGLKKEFEPDEQLTPGIGREHRTVKVPIPGSAEPGNAVYKPTVCWKCNYMQEWYPRCAPLEDLHFKILPAPFGGPPLQAPPNVTIERPK